jgi:hypothetical protein
VQVKARDSDQDRLSLLRKELQLAGVNVRGLFPLWARPRVVQESILREFLVALQAPVHEGLIPPYASLIVSNDTELTGILPLSQTDLELGRKAADGSSALLAFRECSLAGLLLTEPSGAPDLAVVRIVRSLDAVGIRREGNGVVRVHAPVGSLRHAGRQWSTSPSVGQAVDQIRKVAPMADTALLAQLLDFAYYVLSPWNIGATLVWLLSNREPDQIKVDLRPFRLSVSPATRGPSVAFAAHLLAQFDGATTLSREGGILTTGIHLKPSRKSEELIPALAGTRHTSAQRASYDIPDALIVTVSADGPVTVFSDGVNVFELWWYSADRDAASIRKAFGRSVEGAVWTSAREKVCPRCGKTSSIEILTVAGWRDHEEAQCPVCKETIDSDLCYNIHANIRKVF